MNKVVLSEGVNLHLIKSKKFKTTTIAVLIRRKLSRNEATINAVIPGIIKRGCEKYPCLGQIHGHTEDLYGAVFDCSILKKGEEQLIQFFIEVVKREDLTKQALNFLSEIMLKPLIENGGFKKEVVAGEIENLRKAISGRINNKKEYARLRCLEEACINEPFGVYGDGYLEYLDNLDEKNILEHYKEILKTSPIEFVIIGDEDENDLTDFVKSNFNFERGNISQIEKPSLNYQKKEEKTVFEKMDVTQGKICMVLRSGASQTCRDFYNLMVGNEIFGGFTNSKLFSRVREQESLCYYINSFVYKFKTIVFVQCGAETENAKKVVSLVKEQLNAVANGDFSDEEFNNAKTSIIKKYRGIEDYPAATLDFYVSQYMLGDPSTIEDVKKRLNETNPVDIAEIFRKIYVDTVYIMGGEPVEKH